jgi:hypothetical protein
VEQTSAVQLHKRKNSVNKSQLDSYSWPLHQGFRLQTGAFADRRRIFPEMSPPPARPQSTFF